jgi:hypothetical protein
MNNKKNDALGKKLIFFKTSYKKIHLHVKVIFGEKDL